MSSHVRNSESQRDTKDETLPQGDIRERDPWPGKERHSSFRGGNPSKWSDLEANNALKPDDCSRWPSWESSPGDNNMKGAEDINDVRHKMLADPANDEWGRQHHSRPSDESWRQPQRVRGSVQNRSRDRGGSRSRSRSQSRGKTRGMGRSRSRSRSLDRGGAGGRERSRSPFNDDRHESYDSIDRASGTRLSSRVCRDFATGNCRRGSHCRFLHQENLNSRGGNRSDNDVIERSSSRPGYGGASRYGNNRTSADRPHDKVSDGSRRYNGKDEPDVTERSSSRSEYGGASRYGDNRTSADRSHDKVSDGSRRYNGEDEAVRDNKDTFCCKEFLKGRCHWGASCRYPHHVASGDNYNRGNRSASYNHDSKGPANSSGKVPCKHFMIGKCHRAYCRFSHDAPTSEGSGGRSRDDRPSHKADEKKRPWNDPTWDEVTPGLTSIAKSTGRHGSSFQNLNSHDSAAYEKHTTEKKNSWNGPTWDEINASDLSDIANSAGGRDNSVRNLNSHDSAANERGIDDKNKSQNRPALDEVSAPDFGRGNSCARNLNSCDTVGTGKHTDKNKSWNGQTWDETSAPGLSDATIEWGDRSVGNMKSHDSVAIEIQSGPRGGHSWENNNRPRDGPVWNDKTVEKNEYLPPYHRGASNDAYMGTNEFRGMKKLDGNEEPQLVFDCSRSQTLDGVSMPSHERNIMLDLSGREISYRHGGDHPATFDDSNVFDVDMVSEDTTFPVLTAKQVFDQSGHNMGYQSPSNLGGIEQSRDTVSLNSLNGPNVDLSGSVHDIYPPLTRQIQTRIHQNEAGDAQEVLERGVPQVMSEMSETVVSSKQVAQITDLPAILTQISQSGQLPQIFAALKPNNAMGLVHSAPTSTSFVPPVNPMVVQPTVDMKSKEQYDPAMEIKQPGINNKHLGVLSSSIGKENEVSSEHLSLLSTSVPCSNQLHASGVSGEEYQKSPKSKQQGPGVNREVNDNNITEKCKQEQENIQAGNSDARANVEEGNINNDEKAMRLFKIALIEFVKEILKPTWKEGRMSREVHKTIVKKVVDKVTSTLQGIQIPRTPEKIEQYLAFSKSKIVKLVEAYVERFSKPADV